MDTKMKSIIVINSSLLALVIGTAMQVAQDLNVLAAIH